MIGGSFSAFQKIQEVNMLHELFFDEGSIYASICEIDGKDAELSHDIAKLSKEVDAELTDKGRQAWAAMRDKEAEQDAQRLYRAFLKGVQLATELAWEVNHG
jgi:hypothetical protein